MCCHFVRAQTYTLELTGLVLFDQDCHVVLEHFYTVHNLIAIGIVDCFVSRNACA